MRGHLFINNEWKKGEGALFSSFNPATDETVWQGNAAQEHDVNAAVSAAKNAAAGWAQYPIEKRIEYLIKFQGIIEKKRGELSETISKEIGKPLWEADAEVGSIINKVTISIEAYHERCKEMRHKMPHGISITRHKPHGVVAVFGPFNFPGHLPSGHIIPALLAGNTIVLKPSELAPLVAEKLIEYWQETHLPRGVLNLIQGGGKTGEMLVGHADIDGLLFTGSYKTGSLISRKFANFPEKILALEMGGNNPLVVHQLTKNISAAVYHTIQSAYITSGQRCTCARRLIVTQDAHGKHFVEQLIKSVERLHLGPYTRKPEPFLGPVVSKEAAAKILHSYETLVKKGARALVNMEASPLGEAFLTPGLLDVTSVENREDEEIFGPLLQLIWVNNFEDALKEANNTAYGLAAGIFCEDIKDYHRFLNEIKAGVINWNRPLTGASGRAPFGGVGHSGNHRPAGYYAADYCAYPVASAEETSLVLPSTLSPGVSLFDESI